MTSFDSNFRLTMPSRNCCVCGARGDPEKGVYEFRMTAKKKEKWIVALSMMNIANVIDSSVVCSSNFAAEDIIIGTRCVSLRTTAVPKTGINIGMLRQKLASRKQRQEVL